MFNLSAFEGNKNISSGKIGSGIAEIRKLMTQLLHSPETGVKPFKNIGITPILQGDIVTVAGGSSEKDTIHISQFGMNGDAYPDIFGVNISSTINQNAKGYIRFEGECIVNMIDGLSPECGDRIYLSNTPGKGTTTPSQKTLGVIVDSTSYASEKKVTIVIEKWVAGGPG